MPRDPRRVVIALDYYAPYVSGLTEVARQLAEGLVADGYAVTVVAARHDRQLPRRERIAGVDVIRTRVLARIGKGIISPGLPFAVLRAARDAAVLNLHLPMIESGPIARLSSTPVVTTYQCDVELAPGLLGGVQRKVMDWSCALAARSSTVVVVSSIDYAEHSRIADSLNSGRMIEIAPTTRDRRGGSPTFRDGDGFHIGFLGRLVEEKGVPTLVAAFLSIDDPDARLLIGGDFASVAGGSVIEQVRASIGEDPRIHLLGFLDDHQIPDFFASLDGFALPSVNALEAFGIVQVEAMRAGVPVVASDLPGVRIPVQRVGLGELARPGDARSLADALRRLIGISPERRSAAAARATELYSAEGSIRAFETVLLPEESPRTIG